jgi:hypothetical protein
MTEADWLACTDPQKMLDWSQGQAGERKPRLCASAWMRSVFRHAHTSTRIAAYSQWLAESQWLPQLDAAERFADGQISRKELRAARQTSGGPYNIFLAACRASDFSLDAVYRLLQSFQREFGAPSNREVRDLTRDVINPFRTVSVRTLWLNWNDGTVPKLARSIYDERAFDRLPILADALEDAGCDNADVLAHCRGPGEHVRGCWVVDLLLGKT